MAAVGLFNASGPDVESPYAEPYAFGIAILVNRLAEQQLGDTVLHMRGHLSDESHAPGVRRPETVNQLVLQFRIYLEHCGGGGGSRPGRHKILREPYGHIAGTTVAPGIIGD